MKKIILLCLSLYFISASYAQLSKTVTISAGGLYAALTSLDRANVTTLKIKGIMDTRDFKTIRDDMTRVENLDLSGVVISTYTGYLGTDDYFANSVYYPANSIPQYAFYKAGDGAHGPNSIIFPPSITSIGFDAFYACVGLKTPLFPSSLNTIGVGAFMFCSGLTDTLTIPSSVTTIERYAFAGCSSLSFLQFAPRSSALSIEEYAFKTCLQLSGTLTIPSSVNNIGQHAFEDCYRLSGLNFALPCSLTSINEGTFASLGVNWWYYPDYMDTLKIPNTITSIGNGAFRGSNFKVVSIPSSVTNIGEFAFQQCAVLTRVDFATPSSIISLGSTAFNGCGNLKNTFCIPTNVQYIGSSTFASDTALKSITIPSSVTTIGDAAFWNCSGLRSIYAGGSTPVDLTASASVFDYIDKDSCTLYVPINTKTLYETASQWKDFTNIIERPFSYWIGGENDEWENPLNWSTGNIPTAATVVYINSGSPPLTVRSNATCFSLNITTGANFTIANGYNMTITGP